MRGPSTRGSCLIDNDSAPIAPRHEQGTSTDTMPQPQDEVRVIQCSTVLQVEDGLSGLGGLRVPAASYDTDPASSTLASLVPIALCNDRSKPKELLARCKADVAPPVHRDAGDQVALMHLDNGLERAPLNDQPSRL